jgi:hypothetical protein
LKHSVRIEEVWITFSESLETVGLIGIRLVEKHNEAITVDATFVTD